MVGFRAFFLLFIPLFLPTLRGGAQNDVMLQAFYWDVPVDAQKLNGIWWDHLADKAATLRNSGITAIWVPSPCKGNFGIYDMGYGIFDLYDLGNYPQKGTTETRFGSRDELQRMVREMHANNIEVYADAVMNHLYSNLDQQGENPAVKSYVFSEGKRRGRQFAPFPTNEITWVITDAKPGKYEIGIRGYHLSKGDLRNAYDLDINVDSKKSSSNRQPRSVDLSSLKQDSTISEFPLTIHSIYNSWNRDLYYIDVRSSGEIVIRLTAMEIEPGGGRTPATQFDSYYPVSVIYQGKDIAGTNQLEARTNTSFSFIRHNGKGERNFKLDYTHFHPGSEYDSLTYYRENVIVSNCKMFGNDVNTDSPEVQKIYNDWGRWMCNEVGFDGFRVDWVRGFNEGFLRSWVRNLPLKSKVPRFVVGEYWGDKKAISQWVTNVGESVSAFDFPLKSTLTSMCNNPGDEFDMRTLRTAGLISEHLLPSASVVTFVENHDTGKEHDKWVMRDWKLAYAYILTHPGRPCIFYNHLFGDPMIDHQNSAYKVMPDANLRNDIELLIWVRKNYLEGEVTILSDTTEACRNLYVMHRKGSEAEARAGALIAINNHDTEERSFEVVVPADGIWVDLLDPRRQVLASERKVRIGAPARGYSIFVRKEDFKPYPDIQK